MDVKQWKTLIDYNSQVDVKINELLSLYVQAIMNYFSLPEDIKDFEQLFIKLEEAKVSNEKELFRKWLNKKGRSFLESLRSEAFEDNQKSVSMIDYQIYLLSEELDMQYPEDLISALIGIEEELPNFLSEAYVATYEITLLKALKQRSIIGNYLEAYSNKTHFVYSFVNEIDESNVNTAIKVNIFNDRDTKNFTSGSIKYKPYQTNRIGSPHFVDGPSLQVEYI